MKLIISFLAMLLTTAWTYSAKADEVIRVPVGMYPFSPFVDIERAPNNTQQLSGMTIDLITALNQTQKKYHFEALQIPAKRRYHLYKEKHYDVIFYENKNWGWENIDIQTSDTYQYGGEVYVALKKPGRGQEYFDDFSGKRMMGILGFHYGFSDFSTNEEYLTKHFYMHFSYDNSKNITLLLKERGDIAVVTKAYLQRYLLEHPQEKDKLLISEKLDQEYRHTVLVRPGIKPTVDEINHMLENLRQSGALAKLWKKYGIETEEETLVRLK